MKVLACCFVLVTCLMVRADSIDDAEAARRGITPDQVRAERAATTQTVAATTPSTRLAIEIKPPGDPQDIVENRQPVVTKTADGVDYPKPDPHRMGIRLPLIGDALGAVPEDLVGKKVVKSIQKSANLIAENIPGKMMPVFDDESFVTKGVAEATDVSFDLDHGRIFFICLHYQTMSDTRMKYIVRSAQKLSPDGITVGSNSATGVLNVNKHNIFFYMVVEDDSEGLVIFSVKPADWYLFYHPETTDKVVSAIKDSSVIIGMTMDEVKAAWGSPDHRSESISSDGKHVEWNYEDPNHTVSFDVDGKVDFAAKD